LLERKFIGDYRAIHEWKTAEIALEFSHLRWKTDLSLPGTLPGRQTGGGIATKGLTNGCGCSPDRDGNLGYGTEVPWKVVCETSPG
jgi:hypothetical protein